jgi:hypothetical protein
VLSPTLKTKTLNSRDVERSLVFEKIKAFIKLINSVLAGSFPTSDSVTALTKIRDSVEDLLAEFEQVEDDVSNELFQQYCKSINSTIVEYLPHVGLLLRSGNVRNSFESYLPLKNLAAELIGQKIKLVMSSEWNFSPFIDVRPTSALYEYSFIGFPASESENPLVLPLAGHEIGHAIWRRTNVGNSHAKAIERAIITEARENWQELEATYSLGISPTEIANDLFAISLLKTSYEYAKRQIEELFCDVVGIFVFGESYLQAFRYLVAPAVSDHRSHYYPPMSIRVEFNADAFKTIFNKDVNWFKECFTRKTDTDQRAPDLLLRMADNVTKKYFENIVQAVLNYMPLRSIEKYNESEVDVIYESFKKVCPVNKKYSIASILGAAWKLRLNIESLETEVRGDHKVSVLCNLVLKSFEVWELNVRAEKVAHA